MFMTLVDLSTGDFIKEIECKEAEYADAYLTPGTGLIEGQYNFNSQAIDTVTFEVINRDRMRSPEEIQSEIVAGVQTRLDAFAQTRGYDSILSACTYANDPDARFQAEGLHAVTVRGAAWKRLYDMLADVQTGARPIPADFAAIADEFVIPDWPEL